MSIFAVYDTSGIQDYVFASGKFSECKGASALVRSIFAKGGLFAQAFPEDGVTDWEALLSAPDDSQISGDASAQIICAGGGNAYALFADEPTFQAVTERFLKSVLKNAYGMGVAAAAVETNLAGFVADYTELRRRLRAAKHNINKTLIVGAQSVTRTDPRTGEPVTRLVRRHGEYTAMSEGRYLKSRVGMSSGVKFDDLTEDDNAYLGVIHADGNNMSDRIRDFVTSEDNWPKAVKNLRAMSASIPAYFGRAFELTMRTYAEYFSRNGIADVPEVIKLVDDGEDMTVVVQGKYAVSFAAEYLRNIEALNGGALSPFPGRGKAPLTACAGAAIFRSHFPFIKAYEMASELCGSAKRRAVELEKEGKALSYIDFHMHSGGLVRTVSDFRSDYYPKAYLREKLYSRPLCVSAGADGHDGYALFSGLLSDMRGGLAPRSKLKDIRSALAAYGENSFYHADSLIAALGLEFGRAKPRGEHKYAKLNDALEFMDMYEDLREGR